MWRAGAYRYHREPRLHTPRLMRATHAAACTRLRCNQRVSQRGVKASWRIGVMRQRSSIGRSSDQ